MSETPAAYRVLARKYRPAAFGDLIGQEALVRILTNAIRAGRIAHAFMLTGVRGVGKTTTARILARALNCLGPDGSRDAPAEEPCGVCESCMAIAADRHVDVIEMDAASHTGVDDVREIIEATRYRPVSARFKVYIVDEVHMLSRQAFNALLKTLEEPPGHVKFIFATTEIRKVPVTVLSRCQRFDLRRVPAGMLEAHFAECGREGRCAEIEPEALARIARAADGSVRDGLSILDQAIVEADGRRIAADAVNEMLGLADRLDIYDLFEALMRGEPAAALAQFDEMYRAGADPGLVLQDMAELVHRLTRARVVPAEADDAALPEAERVRGRKLAEALSLPALTRVWQLVLRGIQEVNTAPSAKPAFEMVLLRIGLCRRLADAGGGDCATARRRAGRRGSAAATQKRAASRACPCAREKRTRTRSCLSSRSASADRRRPGARNGRGTAGRGNAASGAAAACRASGLRRCCGAVRGTARASPLFASGPRRASCLFRAGAYRAQARREGAGQLRRRGRLAPDPLDRPALDGVGSRGRRGSHACRTA